MNNGPQPRIDAAAVHLSFVFCVPGLGPLPIPVERMGSTDETHNVHCNQRHTHVFGLAHFPLAYFTCPKPLAKLICEVTSLGFRSRSDRPAYRKKNSSGGVPPSGIQPCAPHQQVPEPDLLPGEACPDRSVLADGLVPRTAISSPTVRSVRASCNPRPLATGDPDYETHPIECDARRNVDTRRTCAGAPRNTNPNAHRRPAWTGIARSGSRSRSGRSRRASYRHC